MSSDPSPLIAIVGAGRNGSTLIARLLDGSPDVWIHPVDVVFLPIWDDIAKSGHATGASLRTATTRRLRRLDIPLERRVIAPLYLSHAAGIETDYLERLVDAYPLRREELEVLLGPGTTTLPEFVPALVDAFRRASARRPDERPRYLAFKTSETAYVDDFVRIFPGMKFVHIIRHPLPNYASLKRTWMVSKQSPFWGRGEDILQMFLEARWLPHARSILRWRHDDPVNHVLVRYEDLCLEPEREVRRVCGELGIRPPADPAEQTTLGGEQVTQLPPNPSKPGVATPTHVVKDMAAAFGYEPNLTDREVALIGHMTANEARALGYDDMSRTNRLRLWLRWLPVDAVETENVRSWRRWTVEIARRRLYVTRRVLFS